MTPETWKRIEGLFEQATSLDEAGRAALLQSLPPDLGGPLRSLLEADAAGSQPIASAIAEIAAPSLNQQTASRWVDRRLGAYRITREIGRGGMGVVFEAVRDDDHFQKRVALKVAVRASLSPVLREAFRRERQILAQLDHPNISRLIDGGETEEGLPYFVMEMVEGVPVHTYCQDNKLPVRGRLRLFLDICDAVNYAHQNLVVHRDIKPGNILVTRDGVPKLLDFGVAKLLDEQTTASGSTQTAFVPVTPDYCSPEQLRSLRITTRTDVYLLGLLLYELLTGRRAVAADTSSPTALEHSICESEPPRASSVAGIDRGWSKSLEGDLDTIIEKALRKEPEARFATAGELAAEIRLHLDGMPIQSRSATLGYRASRFIRRNRIAVTGSAVLALALIAGIAGTLFQARRAARRFEQVRGIARALMFDVHTAIRDLPGSVPAQETVVQTALQYLDRLSEEVSGDPALQLEVAEGYTRIGKIQGSSLVPSLNNRTQARQSLDKASQLLRELIRRQPDSEHVASALAECHSTMAEMQSRAGESEAAGKLLRETEAVIAPLASQPSASLDLRRRLGLIRVTLARDFGDGPGGVALADSLLEAVRLIESHPKAAGTEGTRGEIAVGSSVAGGVFLRAGKLTQAVPLLEKAVALNRATVESQPDNTVYRRGLMLAHSKAAELYLQPGTTQNRPKAGEHLASMVAQADWLFHSDPERKSNRIDLAMASIRSAEAFPVGDDRALPKLELGLKMLEEESRRDAKDTAVRRQIVEGIIRLGQHHREKKEWAAAMSVLNRAAQTAEDVHRVDPGRPANRNVLLKARMELGRLHAIRGDQAALAVLEARIDQAATPDQRPRVERWKSENQQIKTTYKR